MSIERNAKHERQLELAKLQGIAIGKAIGLQEAQKERSREIALIESSKKEIQRLREEVTRLKRECERLWGQDQLKGGALAALLETPDDAFVRRLANTILGNSEQH